MPGPWDDVVKELLRKSPEQFAEWLVAEGSFVAILQLKRSARVFTGGSCPHFSCIRS